MESGVRAGRDSLLAKARIRGRALLRPCRTKNVAAEISVPEAARVLLEAWLSSVQRGDSGQWRMPSSEGLRELLISTVDQLPGGIDSRAAGPKSALLSPGSGAEDSGDAESSKDAASRAGNGVRSSRMEAARARMDLDRDWDRAAPADPEAAPPPVSQTDADAKTEAAAENVAVAEAKAVAEIPAQRSAAPRLVVGEPRREPVATIRLLGRYTIEGPGRSIVIGRPRDAWLLLGLLVEYRHAPLQRQIVIGKMWPDADPAESIGRFWTVVKRTRVNLCKALDRPTDHGKYVVQNIGTSSYRLNAGLFRTDVWQLRDALALAERGPTGERVAALETAVELHTGTFLPDADHDWAQSAARAIDRSVVRALTQLADLEGDQERAAHWLERATAIDPAAEHLLRRRMRTYADLGRHQAVHDCYAELREQLRSAGDRPEQRTTQLYRRLVAQAE